MRIFILEDDPDRIVRFAKEFEGHQVQWAQTCARQHEFDGSYDIIFLDHDLGGRQMDHYGEDTGLNFMRLVADRIYNTTQIVIHSWNPEGAAAMKARYPGGLCVIAPFNSDEFNNIVKQIRGK